jgi:hypothetical protein
LRVPSASLWWRATTLPMPSSLSMLRGTQQRQTCVCVWLCVWLCVQQRRRSAVARRVLARGERGERAACGGRPSTAARKQHSTQPAAHVLALRRPGSSHEAGVVWGALPQAHPHATGTPQSCPGARSALT